MRSGRPQSAEERASLLEVGQDVTKDVEEQVGVVISEDQSGAEADGLVATAPQHQAWKERHGGLGGVRGSGSESPAGGPLGDGHTEVLPSIWTVSSFPQPPIQPSFLFSPIARLAHPSLFPPSQL